MGQRQKGEARRLRLSKAEEAEDVDVEETGREMVFFLFLFFSPTSLWRYRRVFLLYGGVSVLRGCLESLYLVFRLPSHVFYTLNYMKYINFEPFFTPLHDEKYFDREHGTRAKRGLASRQLVLGGVQGGCCKAERAVSVRCWPKLIRYACILCTGRTLGLLMASRISEER